MEYLRKYIEIIPYFNNEKKKASMFGITEDMVPSFSRGRKGIKLTDKPCMRYRFLRVEDHIVPLYPEREKPIREKIENVQLQGTFNLREEIKKVTFKEIEDEEIEAVEYEVKRTEEEIVEQPHVRGQYLYKYFEKTPLKWHGPMGMSHKEFHVQGSIAADNKVKVVDLSENRSFNPIKHVTWHMTSQIFTEGDDYSLVDPFPLFEGFEWYITRETIGHYLTATVYRGNYIGKGQDHPIQAKDLHFNGKKKSILHEESPDYLTASNIKSEADPDFDKYITEEAVLGPVLIPDYMAYQILGFICEEGLSCNIILLDCPRPSFSLDREDSAKLSDSKAKPDGSKLEGKECEKKTMKKKRTNSEESEDGLDGKEETHSDDDQDVDGDGDEDENEDEDEDEDDQDQTKSQRNNGIKSMKSKFLQKKVGSGLELSHDSNLNSDLDSKDDDSYKSDQDDEDEEDEDYDDDYLAFKRETYRGTFEAHLMDGLVRISYNTKKDERKERRKRRKMERMAKENNKGENSEGKPVDYKLSYHKSIEFGFDQFFFSIEHKQNKSIVKMIIFETESRCYEIRFRVDPELGRDNLYYTMVAFQGCYKNQDYNWDDHLRNGNISPIKELVQKELESLALKGYN